MTLRFTDEALSSSNHLGPCAVEMANGEVFITRNAQSLMNGALKGVFIVEGDNVEWYELMLPPYHIVLIRPLSEKTLEELNLPPIPDHLMETQPDSQVVPFPQRTGSTGETDQTTS